MGASGSMFFFILEMWTCVVTYFIALLLCKSFYLFTGILQTLAFLEVIHGATGEYITSLQTLI